jgi:hypothetical protein
MIPAPEILKELEAYTPIVVLVLQKIHVRWTAASCEVPFPWVPRRVCLMGARVCVRAELDSRAIRAPYCCLSRATSRAHNGDLAGGTPDAATGTRSLLLGTVLGYCRGCGVGANTSSRVAIVWFVCSRDR